MKTFKDLDVWNKSMDLSLCVYTTTKNFPKEEIYGLISQLRRSSVSIPSNIAEGSKRSKKDSAHFIKIAQGSGSELETQIIIAEKLGLIENKEGAKLKSQLEDIMKMLSKLYLSLN
jgi:four helix bundle protein